MRLIFLLLLIGAGFSVAAQETVEVRRKAGPWLLERYFVLKKKRGVKHGPYEFYDHGRYLTSTGLYENGKRVGRWNFYRAQDSLEQRYNYTTNTVEYSAPDPNEFEYKFEEPLKEGDKITYPVIIGGRAGMWRLLNVFSLAVFREGRRDFSTDYYRAVFFHVDENGELQKLDTFLQSQDKEKLYHHPLNRKMKSYISFFPAKVNGKSVKSVIVYKYLRPVRVSR